MVIYSQTPKIQARRVMRKYSKRLIFRLGAEPRATGVYKEVNEDCEKAKVQNGRKAVLDASKMRPKGEHQDGANQHSTPKIQARRV